MPRTLTPAQVAANRSRAKLPRANKWHPALQPPEEPWTQGHLLAETLVRGEDPNSLARLHQNFRTAWCPSGFIEEVLVEKMTVCYWRMRRIYRAECGSVEGRFIGAAKEIARQYEARHPGHKNSKPEHFIDQIEEPLCETIGKIVSSPSTEIIMSLAFHEAGIEREFYRAMRCLAQIQRARIRGLSPAEGLDAH